MLQNLQKELLVLPLLPLPINWGMEKALQSFDTPLLTTFTKVARNRNIRVPYCPCNNNTEISYNEISRKDFEKFVILSAYFGCYWWWCFLFVLVLRNGYKMLVRRKQQKIVSTWHEVTLKARSLIILPSWHRLNWFYTMKFE